MATDEEFFRLQREYWRQVAESDGFDIENVRVPDSMVGKIAGLIPHDCLRYRRFPYGVLVKHYAIVGLHRYNMLKGTNFQFGRLMKFNMLQNCVSSFYMTLEAFDHFVSGRFPKTFQIRIDEKTYGSLDLTVSIARTTDEVTTKKPFIPHYYGGAVADGIIFEGELPDWPSDDDLKHRKRFYVVKESEWRDTAWIFMYLELVLCAHDRSITDADLARLKIVKVAIETSIEDALPNERLKAKSANVYILFKGLEEPRVPQQVFVTGMDVERKAIIRRVMDDAGYLTLVGKLCGGVKKVRRFN
ncbi:UPF0725 protein At1g23960 [Arabidopsis lyrata subsp. lyrata]|uniref:UPF0725 protein At1g23960 n=1 Tax=Arabidopsis lyrata subsp. lyrata TaxID=81972 RepID=UPI000A29D11A|nr:UPF0725 protein At1g23960 [Arabidopsis lyrata subsp. lyrata]|eukprot:XP_020866285.1 UPF0725 protein At1g23960 [Arabidopsis lyrata subsp. lyrata]